VLRRRRQPIWLVALAASCALSPLGAPAAAKGSWWPEPSESYIGRFDGVAGSRIILGVIGEGKGDGRRRVLVRAIRVPQTCEGQTPETTLAAFPFRFPAGRVFSETKTTYWSAEAHAVVRGTLILRARGVLRRDGTASGVFYEGGWYDSGPPDAPNCTIGPLRWHATERPASDPG